ncbi:amylo-alpha-1,6-glucosidase [Planosporangium thailandense]|uniref:Amylo-alpha-1,6-glucosidase n=2 Tax=Planosporangium thailandense TaxID=765197 RepID=A0ABX0XW46_9ACTN|nr:amylo-alpha-1,6-glucosidase [Planosporangium thailandense]NJC70023.1 amylo-alpha-1,6-glucosidase [Planosporangium thailandense]
MPVPSPDGQPPAATTRNLPPELGADAVAVLDGPTFMYSNAVGDVPDGSIGGLVHEDTRFLGRWELTVNNSPLLVLGSDTVDYYSAAFFLTNPELPDLRANTIGVRRERFVGDGMHERIGLESFTAEPVSIQLRLAVGTDFADLFEIKDVVARDRSAKITRSHAVDGSRLCFDYRNRSFEARTEVKVHPPASRVEGDDLVWDLQLARHHGWWCELIVPLHFLRANVRPARRIFGGFCRRFSDDPVADWRANLPTLHSDSELLRDLIEKSMLDLHSLRMEKRLSEQERVVLPAAGLPWFLTLFGRDTLITAYQTLAFGPNLAHGTLRKLAVRQGRVVDDFTDQEPGKILHEVRHGELTQLGLRPHNPYYGTIDATALWLILLSEYWRWTGDDDFVVGLRDNAYAALRWIDEYGDRDGDGYVEYATRSPQGLGNQCWRDSWDGVQFANGTIPVLPIATCETQGYTYDAKLRLAQLADGPLNEPELARTLRAQAADLYERFNRDFWIDERGGYYAIGLDGDKRQIDSMTSNMGQLLWSGIVPPERAATVARQLMSDEMFSGWGVRTTSTADHCYNPIGYHMGTVWPHDNSLIAHGLARYGFRDEANRIITAMLQAAEFSHYRLPEALSGYDRCFGRVPVPYPTACSPQAWATAAPFLFVRTMLGLDARDGELVVDPAVPEAIRRIKLARANAFGKRWDVEVAGSQAYVRLAG